MASKTSGKGTAEHAAEKGSRLEVFVVENWKGAEGDDKSNWIRVGVAFPHGDGKGFNVELRAMPVGGKLVLREPRERERGHE